MVGVNMTGTEILSQEHVYRSVRRKRRVNAGVRAAFHVSLVHGLGVCEDVRHGVHVVVVVLTFLQFCLLYWMLLLMWLL